MKLIKRTYILTAKWFLPLMIAGSIFCFYMIEYISYEEADEFLTYEMQRLVNYHEEFNDLPEFHQVTNIIPDLRLDKPMFKDTMILETGDNEMMPYRELHFSINHHGTYQTLVLRHLLLGRDDIAEGTILIIIGLMLLVGFSLFIIVNYMAGKIWNPFYKTLDKLVKFKISGPVPEFPATTIDEFKTLNTTLGTLLKKVSDDYRHNKEFSENTSHELQTHLAVIRASTEKLLNKPDEVPQIEELQKIYVASTKLSQVQKSFFLLSKINNREYSNPVEIDLRKLIVQALGFFEEAIAIRGIKVERRFEPCSLSMDTGLAEILVNNLIKNAVKHNIQNGDILITLSASALIIENSGLPFAGNAETLLERFAKGKNGNIGIGLAIVNQICELYSFRISYIVSEQARHQISISF
ncbi:MAG: HAMP domain-containing histidine kinase [Prolixibacteraceae bacterium]|nr:HAMP domain-containing histidine kinase [Prolixibacteraceae bacterium]